LTGEYVAEGGAIDGRKDSSSASRCRQNGKQCGRELRFAPAL